MKGKAKLLSIVLLSAVMLAGCGKAIIPDVSENATDPKPEVAAQKKHYKLIEDTEEKEEKESYTDYSYGKYSELTNILIKITKVTE